MAPGRAAACSHDDTTYFETFLDTSCLLPPLTNTTLDALGGLRLATNGAPAVTSWNTDGDFDNGVTYQSTLFGPVGVSTLLRSGTGAPATLGLPTTLLPLTLDGGNPVLRPTAATVLDSDSVDDPALAKVGSTYYMWYSGTAEDGGGPAIFLATSADGTTWTRANGGNPVLQGTAGAFDAKGVYGADVVYDPSDATAPYRMWYSGRADVFGGIGYATSTNGTTWVKYTGGGPLPVPVLNHGIAGSADSFSAADPSVLKDGSVWKMWYTGDDSNKKRIAYATSADGVTWAKGGKVIAPEDPGVSANIAFGAFAPTVWKTAGGYSMLLTGRKIVGGGVFQTKVMMTTSSDGIVWAGPSPALNPSGTNTNFDFSNLNAPDLLVDTGAATPYKLYYSGNTIDANGNFHTRIGLATSTNGSSFNKVNGGQTGNSVLDVGTLGTAFDARQASGLAAAATGGSGAKYAGFYWGARGSDFKPRLGEATSSDGSAWTKVAGTAEGGAVLALPGGNQFDKGGQRDPSVLHDSGAYDLYFTALDSGGTRSIGFASTGEVAGTLLPDNASWANKAQVLTGDGSGFDASAVSHPSVIKDGSTYVMYYAGTDSGGTSELGRATASAAGGPFTAGASAVLTVGAPGSFDSASVKDPVVAKLGATDYRMLYTGVDADGIERMGYATSTDGSTWTKRGVVLNPSLAAFASDETGVEPTGMLLDGSTLHVWLNGVDRTGRTRGEHVTTGYPTPGSAQPGIPSGWATYQLGSASTTIQDFRQIARASSGSIVTLRMSFLQPYSSGGSEYWSDYFPVTAASTSEALNFLLTVHGVRWRAQLSTPAGSPLLDRVDLTHAPVSFATSGTATAGPIAAAPGRAVTTWGSLVVKSTMFSPGGSGTGAGTVRVLDATSGAQLATAPLNTGGDTTINLSTVPAAQHQALKVALDLTSNGQATPLVQSLQVSYTTQTAPPTVTLAAAPLKLVFGRTVTLTGTVTKDSSGVADAAVVISAKPAGASTFTALTTAATNSTGAYVAIAKPNRTTTYKASYTGVAVEPTVKVSVAFRVTLSVVRKGGKVLVRGKVAPAQRRKVVVIQIRSGKRWKTFAKVRTTRRSTFSTLRTLKRGKYRFRARKPADAQHLAGLSRVVLLRR